MQLSRRPYKDPVTGERRLQQRYTFRFTDHRGIRRSLALLERKAASEAAAQKIERLVDARRGGEPISAALTAWISRMPQRMLEQLIKWNVVEAQRITSHVPVESYVAKWEAHLKHIGNRGGHIRTTVARVRAILAGTRVRTYGDLDVLEIEQWLTERTGPNGWSRSTQQSYVQSIKQFTKWMRMQRFAVDDPLFTLTAKKVGSERQRRYRRALSVEACRSLVAAAEASSRRVETLDGPMRALAYRIALQTGLRLKEIAQLRVQSIYFAQTADEVSHLRPFVDETKAGAKTGRRDVLAIVSSLEPHLRRACAGKHPRAYVIPNLWQPQARGGEGEPRSGANMMRHDLGLAGLPYIDGAGERADFHSLRHTFNSLAASTGIGLDTLMKAARHTDPKVTAQYLHAELRTVQVALEKVPTLDPESQENHPAQAAGAESVVPPMVPQVPVRLHPLASDSGAVHPPLIHRRGTAEDSASLPSPGKETGNGPVIEGPKSALAGPGAGASGDVHAADGLDAEGAVEASGPSNGADGGPTSADATGQKRSDVACPQGSDALPAGSGGGQTGDSSSVDLEEIERGPDSLSGRGGAGADVPPSVPSAEELLERAATLIAMSGEPVLAQLVALWRRQLTPWERESVLRCLNLQVIQERPRRRSELDAARGDDGGDA